MNRYLKIARDECLLSKNKVRFGAVLVIHSGLFVSAHNSHIKTHPLLLKHYPDFAMTAHAEMRCIALYNQYIRGSIPSRAVMYVYREDMNGRQRPAKPCCGCRQILRLAGLSRVRYSTETGFEEMRL